MRDLHAKAESNVAAVPGKLQLLRLWYIPAYVWT